MYQKESIKFYQKIIQLQKWMQKMEVRNNLLNYKGKYIYQDTDCFMFSLDSVMLANFVNIKSNDDFAHAKIFSFTKENEKESKV